MMHRVSTKLLRHHGLEGDHLEVHSHSQAKNVFKELHHQLDYVGFPGASATMQQPAEGLAEVALIVRCSLQLQHHSRCHLLYCPKVQRVRHSSAIGASANTSPLWPSMDCRVVFSRRGGPCSERLRAGARLSSCRCDALALARYVSNASGALNFGTMRSFEVTHASHMS